jgi:alcohol dehydrogenase
VKHATRSPQKISTANQDYLEDIEMNDFTTANQLIGQFKGSAYLHGLDVLPEVGQMAASLGKRVLLVMDTFPGSDKFADVILRSLSAAGAVVAATCAGAAPNAPLEDVTRISAAINAVKPELLISFGGGSSIDAVKAANILHSLGGSMDDYFGTGLVTQKMQAAGKKLLPHLAIQTAASSSAHLTKYSNITNLTTSQKKLVVDEAIVPTLALFDYKVTFGAPASLTADGALDGISHALEVLYSSTGKPAYQAVLPVALEAIRLVVTYLPMVLVEPENAAGREALGLATDLGGYAIMLGGTNGAHLTSFSLVDILSHGRACGLMNPYYTVFFSPAIQQPLRAVGQIYANAGYMAEAPDGLEGRELGLAVAEAMIAFERRIGFPATLGEVKGFSDGHIQRALLAAKNPQLKMKLENMPVPMTAEMVDEYMGPILQAAKTGKLEIIRNVS